MLLRQITGTQVLLAFRASEVSSNDNECLNVSTEIEETLAKLNNETSDTNSMQMNNLWELLALLVLLKESRKGHELMARNTGKRRGSVNKPGT